MIDPRQFRDLVIRPTLIHLDLHSIAAENLLLGTAAHESRLSWLKQHPNGPALGVYQMEPATHDDIWHNYLRYKSDLAAKIIALAGERSIHGEAFNPFEMVGNLYYATAMARVHYLRVKEPLPDGNDIEAMAGYWKQYYNTPRGKGTVEQFVKHYPEGIA